MLRLPNGLKEELKKPQGELLSGDAAVSVVAKAKAGGAPVISVGDRVTCELLSAGVTPDVAVIDGLEMRKPVELVDRGAFVEAFELVNDRGTLNLEGVNVIRSALEHAPSLVLVRGEEDLLGIAAVLAAPEGALVVYGQPSAGVVVVNVDEETKVKFTKIVKAMTPTER